MNPATHSQPHLGHGLHYLLVQSYEPCSAQRSFRFTDSNAAPRKCALPTVYRKDD
ncbi:hypothetical protein RchiOBHm_Chr5g0012651 [Rosa chinensis]|uniref:Uncharacterized protein n=1 Tax=Rosa chinensis TaxID=74649 RepID=A0A2P6Q565_ROSCH|nr:hypothetical protein RchiOBHm_Chr5g0012651 [Rosa chinensis]